MEGQLRMFRLAVEAIGIQSHYVPGHGWEVVVTARRQDETWPEAHRCFYSELTTPELADVIAAELVVVLSL